MRAVGMGSCAVAIVITLTLTIAIATLCAQDVRYEDGWLIDLAAVRGVKATASENLRKDRPAAGFVLHPAEGEVRFDNKFGACWWMAELPGEFAVSDVRVRFRDVIQSVGLRIKVADELPADWKNVKPAGEFSGAVSGSSDGQGFVLLHVNAIKGRFVRLEFVGHNGGEHGAGTGHEDLVVSGVQMWGPNDPGVTRKISVAQSSWAGGTCTLHDCTMDAHAQDRAEVVGDNDPAASGKVATFFTRGSADASVQQTDVPARFVVILKNRVRVAAVGYSAETTDRVERPRDVKVYTSPSFLGNEWALQKEARDISGGEYVEIALDKAVASQRVRFDIEQVWNPKIDEGRKAAEGHIAQLYVYGDALPPDISFATTRPCQASCGIWDSDGKLVRVLELPKAVRAGEHGLCWDGLDDLGRAAPAGKYEARVALNPAKYVNIAVIGNTAQPATIHQNPSRIESVACDSAGNIYTANSWEEESQDFRKWDRETGRHVFDAHGLIRSGNPNGLAYAIAVDDTYIYCATSSHTNHAQQHLRRFRLSDGEPALFSAAAETGGHILVHDRPEDEIPTGTSPAIAQEMKQPLRGIVVVKDKLYVSDLLGGNILCFDRETGARVGSFASILPVALAADSKGRLWVGHEDGTISVSNADGSESRVAYRGLGHIRAIAMGPGDALYVADDGNQQVIVFGADGAKRTFGQRAKPGDYLADHFYAISGLAVESKGNLTVAQALPVDGARLTRFGPDGKVIWDQLGAEFCNTGNFSAEHLDEIVTQNLHRYIVNKRTGGWEFRGSVLDGDARYIRWPHGPLRMRKLGNVEFLFQSYGDGLQVYRREGDLYRLCSMFGCVNPLPDGTFRDAMNVPEDQRPQKQLWWWHDLNGDGKVDETEMMWEPTRGQSVEWDNFGVNVDDQGNALLCEFNNSITEVPVSGFDERGNPIYDLFARRTIVPPDRSDKPLLSDPIMAVRSRDGSIYVTSRSKVFAAPAESGGGWMAGWMLARYDADGKRLWYTRLPEACPGMDCVPGGGVMLVSMKSGRAGCDLYQYSADGALIGIAHPAAEFLNPGGIPDNTGSLSVSRDPRDGKLDVFVEDCLGNRFYWYRVGDREKVEVRKVGLTVGSDGRVGRSPSTAKG